MPLTGSEVITDVQNHLNDASGTNFTTAVVLPLLRIALRDFQALLLAHDISILREETSEQTVTANSTSLSSPPSDMVVPIKLFERTVGSTTPEDFDEMKEEEWAPNLTKDEKLKYWIWKEEAIAFLGATTNRSVKVQYWKLLAELANEGSNIAMEHAQNWLGYRTAYLCADRIGENPTRAESIMNDWIMANELLMGTLNKKEQSKVVKRIPYSRKFRVPYR